MQVKGRKQLNSLVGLSNLKSGIELWETNSNNSDEEFWQEALANYSFVLSQVFSYPVVILDEKAYVGGKSFANKGGGLLDFLARNDVSKNAVLIEIKTPVAKLLGSKYRDGVYPVSKDVVGGIGQVLKYKHTLMTQHAHLREDVEYEVEPFNPPCLVIVGNYEKELDTRKKVRSFELFRRTLKDVEIITYDELFGKAKKMIELLEGDFEQDIEDVEFIEEDEIPF